MIGLRPEDIAPFLSFSQTTIDQERIRNTSQRDWKKLFRWLDDTGLTFYFWQKLRDSSAAHAIPPTGSSRFEQDFAANRQRTDYLWERFSSLNRSFQHAGVRFAVLKGFSHVPQFCPNATLRHQGDLDYLVDERSLPTARRLLEEAGYCLKPPTSNQEFIYILPNVGEPRSGRCYAPEFHAIELHLDIWDSDLSRLPMMDRMFSLERVVLQECNGLSFPALADEDAFLLQVLHTCRHLFTYWIRLSCLYEIGYFLSRRASDDALWNRVAEQVGDNSALRELTVVVSEMVAKLFSAPLPNLVRTWGQEVRPQIRVWIDNYARDCAFGDLPVHRFNLFPRSKLILLLHQQYEGMCAEKHLVRNQLLAPRRIGRMRSAIRKNPSLLLSRKWWKRQRMLRRTIFHVLSGIRYAVEIPRWRWLNWRQSRSLRSLGGLVNARVATRAKSV